MLNAILLLKDERLYMEQYADSIMSKNEKNIVLLSEQQALRLLSPCIPIDSKRKFFVNLKGVKPINGNLWMAVYGITTQYATKNPECKHYLVVYDNACAPRDVMAFDIGKERQVVASSREKERIVTSTRYCVFTNNMHFQRVSAYTQRVHNRTTGKDSILEKRNKWYSYEVDKRGHFLLLDSIIILK